VIIAKGKNTAIADGGHEITDTWSGFPDCLTSTLYFTSVTLAVFAFTWNANCSASQSRNWRCRSDYRINNTTQSDLAEFLAAVQQGNENADRKSAVTQQLNHVICGSPAPW